MSDFQNKIDLKLDECNKETNGLFYWIGTNGKTESYANPFETKKVGIRSSELKDPCKKDKSAMISLQGPAKYCISKVVKDKESSFFIVDLKDKWINPTHYVIRNYVYGHIYWNRDWCFEGSVNSGNDWIIIDQQKNNNQLKGIGKIVSFKINKNIKDMVFNQFRMSSVQLSDNCYQFACSGFELFGTLYQNKACIINEEKSANSMSTITDNLNIMNVELKSIMHQQQNQDKLNEENKSMKDMMNNVLLSLETIKYDINKLKGMRNSYDDIKENDETKTIKQWLSSFKLEQYSDNFILNGFDSMDIINEIKDINDINEIGIKLKGHQTKILLEINKAKTRQWLTFIVKLPQYYSEFMSNGYETLEMIKTIRYHNELNEIGIKLKGHQLKILSEINKLHKLKEHNEELNDFEGTYYK